MLNDQELAEMGSVLVSTMPDTCTIESPARIPESPDTGGWQDTWVVRAANVPVRVSPAPSDKGYDKFVGGSDLSIGEWTITLPTAQEIEPKDRINFGGRIFEVRVVGARSYEISRRVYCSEIR